MRSRGVEGLVMVASSAAIRPLQRHTGSCGSGRGCGGCAKVHGLRLACGERRYNGLWGKVAWDIAHNARLSWIIGHIAASLQHYCIFRKSDVSEQLFEVCKEPIRCPMNDTYLYNTHKCKYFTDVTLHTSTPNTTWSIIVKTFTEIHTDT